MHADFDEEVPVTSVEVEDDSETTQDEKEEEEEEEMLMPIKKKFSWKKIVGNCNPIS